MSASRLDELEAEKRALARENAELRSRVAALETHLQLAHPPALISTPAEIAAARPYIRGHSLTPREIARYGRHLILPDLGPRAQERWCRGSALVIGAGGLGASVCLYLASCGVGRVTIVDDDTVDLTNLHRQVIHSELTVGQKKAESARDACLRLNSSISVTAVCTRFSAANALQLARAHDVVIDASDNVATRYLASDAAVLAGKPCVSGSALRSEGQLTVYNSHPDTPCYRCLFPTPPPATTVLSCADGGVWGPVPGLVGTLQAAEALKLLAGAPAAEVFSRRMLLIDAGTGKFRTVALRARVPTCAACGISVPEPASSTGARADLGAGAGGKPVRLTAETLAAGALPGLEGAVCMDTLAAATDAADAAADTASTAGTAVDKPAAAAVSATVSSLGREGPVVASDSDNDGNDVNKSDESTAAGAVRMQSLSPAAAWALITAGRALVLDVRDDVQRAIAALPVPPLHVPLLLPSPHAPPQPPGVSAADTEASPEPAPLAAAAAASAGAGASATACAAVHSDACLVSSADVHLPWRTLQSPEGAAALRTALDRWRTAIALTISGAGTASSDSSCATAPPVPVPVPVPGPPPVTVVVVCRRGVYSRAAARLLSQWPEAQAGALTVVNLRGGLEAFQRDVDPGFPVY
jgi:adenylyltransferase/sulfurtransferase